MYALKQKHKDAKIDEIEAELIELKRLYKLDEDLRQANEAREKKLQQIFQNTYNTGYKDCFLSSKIWNMVKRTSTALQSIRETADNK